MKDNKKIGKINEINEDPFEEYIRLGEPDKADKAYAWQTAVGLQDVDRLQPSEYLLDAAFISFAKEIRGLRLFFS